MVDLKLLEIFYQVARCQSFSKAAQVLEISKGYVSAQISSLEKTLGIQLLHRTTRHLSLTAEGQILFEACAKIVEEKQNALAILQEVKGGPSGRLTITAPPSMCSTFLAQIIPQFLEKYPQITVTIDSSATIKNLVEHGIDIAIRSIPTPTENYVARLVTHYRFVITTTKNYLKQHQAPSTPKHLIDHNCLIYLADPNKHRWQFEDNKKVEEILVKGNLACTDSNLIKNALLAGAGITRLPYYILAKEIANQEVTVLFEQQTRMLMPIYVQYNSQSPIPPRIRCFLEFIQTALSPQLGLGAS